MTFEMGQLKLAEQGKRATLPHHVYVTNGIC